MDNTTHMIDVGAEALGMGFSGGALYYCYIKTIKGKNFGEYLRIQVSDQIGVAVYFPNGRNLPQLREK